MGRVVELLRFAVEACSGILPCFEWSREALQPDVKIAPEMNLAVDQL